MSQLADKWREFAKRDDCLDPGHMVLSDVRRLVAEIDDLEAALRGLMEWQEQPEVRNETVVVANHGIRYTPKQIGRLHGYWERATAILDKVGTE